MYLILKTTLGKEGNRSENVMELDRRPSDCDTTIGLLYLQLYSVMIQTTQPEYMADKGNKINSVSIVTPIRIQVNYFSLSIAPKERRGYVSKTRSVHPYNLFEQNDLVIHTYKMPQNVNNF